MKDRSTPPVTRATVPIFALAIGAGIHYGLETINQIAHTQNLTPMNIVEITYCLYVIGLGIYGLTAWMFSEAENTSIKDEEPPEDPDDEEPLYFPWEPERTLPGHPGVPYLSPENMGPANGDTGRRE